MQYVELKQKLKKFIVFTTKDIKQVDADFQANNLMRWMEKGYIKQLRRNYYMFSDIDINESVLFEVANRIYSPSYISLEAALSYYGLIPETVFAITSVSTRKTNRFSNDLGKFSYKTLSKDLFWGYNIVNDGLVQFAIAEPEKLLLDYLYLNSHLDSDADFHEIRFNFREFEQIYNVETLEKYTNTFDNKTLRKRVIKFMDVHKNA